MRKDCHKPTYISWQAMKTRCTNEKSCNYAFYKGAGISYETRWEKVDNFLQDMGERPEDMTLDRIDSSKSYSKENCRWATSKEQQSNKKNILHITYNGVTKTASEWSLSLGMVKGAVWNRIKLCGWSIEKAVTTPKREKAYQ